MTTNTTKTSLVLAAFAAAFAAQPASATAIVADAPNSAVSDPLALIRPSSAALDQLMGRAGESAPTVEARKRGPFVRIIFVQAVPKRV